MIKRISAWMAAVMLFTTLFAAPLQAQAVLPEDNQAAAAETETPDGALQTLSEQAAPAAQFEGQQYYLSNLNWVSATHGDISGAKSVQKDKPFTPGNDGIPGKIRLNIDGKEQVFEKGLGTVATSVITYDISGAGVTGFSSYIGLGLHATYSPETNHGLVEGVEVVVDGEVLQRIEAPKHDGVLVEVEVPKDARVFQLKCYSGTETWADEIVYADAKFYATGEFKDPDNWTPAPMRREVSNEKPLMIIPLYAKGTVYKQEQPKYEFWGDDTLVEKWEAVPDDLKPYTVIELHPDDLPNLSEDPYNQRETAAKDFYEHFLEIAQNHKDPKTGEADPIPLILTVFTAGNSKQYTAASWIDLPWIEEMYMKYSCLQGIFSTENYWVWTGGLESQAARYLELSAKYGGYFIWSEQNNGGSIQRVANHEGFRTAMEKYADNFIFTFKNTPADAGNDAPTASYMTGLWLAGYVDQWGGLMDTWKWYETGKWKLFAEGSVPKHMQQGNRQWLTEPEALVGIEALMVYLNGGCVYNFEHPAYTYGVKNMQSPLYQYVIQEFFRYIIAHPAPSREEMLSRTKAVVHGDFTEMGNGEFFAGLNTEMAVSPTYTTGRYGNIPAIPKGISREKVDAAFEGRDIRILDRNSSELASLAQKKTFFGNLYPQEYSGDIFAQRIDHRWFVYNYKYNENINQTGDDMTLTGTVGNDKDWTAKVEMEPHTYLIMDSSDNKVHIRLNNYRVNKDELWEGAENAAQAGRLPSWDKPTALDWIDKNYIHNTKDQEKRTTTIVLKGVEEKPSIENVQGLKNNFETPVVTYDAQEKTATVTITCNGYVYFDVVGGEKADTQAPSVPTNVTAGEITSQGALLSWEASTDDVGVARYEVYSGDELVKEVTDGQLSLQLANLTAETTYTYRVCAVDAAGNRSPFASVTFTTKSASTTDPTTKPEPTEPQKPEPTEPQKPTIPDHKLPVQTLGTLEIHKGYTGEVGICVKADISSFVRVLWDGKVLSPEHYTLEEGTIVVKLKPAFVKTLAVGSYQLKVETLEGYSEVTIKVAEAAAPSEPAPQPNPPAGSNPQTGDFGFGVMAVALMVSLAAATLIWNRKKAVK